MHSWQKCGFWPNFVLISQSSGIPYLCKILTLINGYNYERIMFNFLTKMKQKCEEINATFLAFCVCTKWWKFLIFVTLMVT